MLQSMEEGENLVHKGDTGVEKIWSGTMDDWGMILWIQALIDAKIANKGVINTHSHSDFAPNI